MTINMKYLFLLILFLFSFPAYTNSDSNIFKHPKLSASYSMGFGKALTYGGKIRLGVSISRFDLSAIGLFGIGTWQEGEDTTRYNPSAGIYTLSYRMEMLRKIYGGGLEATFAILRAKELFSLDVGGIIGFLPIQDDVIKDLNGNDVSLLPAPVKKRITYQLGGPTIRMWLGNIKCRFISDVSAIFNRSQFTILAGTGFQISF
jgi:hypothetical protein